MRKHPQFSQPSVGQGAGEFKWGFPKIRGYHFGGLNNKDYSILGSILGSPYFGKSTNLAAVKQQFNPTLAQNFPGSNFRVHCSSGCKRNRSGLKGWACFEGVLQNVARNDLSRVSIGRRPLSCAESSAVATTPNFLSHQNLRQT